MSAATDDSAHAVSESRDQLVGVELLPGEEADAIVASLVGDERVRITYHPGVVIIEAPHRLEIRPAEVAEQLGRPWVADDLQIIMGSYFGFISAWDDDLIVLEWLRSATT